MGMAFRVFVAGMVSMLGLGHAAGPLTIMTTACPDGKQLSSYAGCLLEGSGGIPPYTWSVLTGQKGFAAGTATLPEGLEIVVDTVKGTLIGGQGYYGPTIVLTDSTSATTSTLSIGFNIAGDNTLAGCELFPSTSIFHTRVDKLPIDASPAAPIPAAFASAQVHPFFGGGESGGALPNGIPFIRVPFGLPNQTVNTTLFQHDFTSAPDPVYTPIEASANAGWNGAGGDRHALVVQEAGPTSTCRLYEMWQARRDDPQSSTVWTDSSNAAWPDLTSNNLRPNGLGSCDACGLPITPLLANYDETCGAGGSAGCVPGVIKHPIRFTLQHTLPYWVWPGRAAAGVGQCKWSNSTVLNSGQQIPQGAAGPASCSFNGAAFSAPCGQIYRLRATVPTPPGCENECAVIVTALRNYGLIVADNGASGGLIGTPDARWNDTALSMVRGVRLSDFEPVDVSGLIVDNDSGEAKSL
eukprot:m.13845 g.13845  ORF g.13845 m.13845 type:complete len:467 (-) comp8244_c0_seq1:288-1688(-)